VRALSTVCERDADAFVEVQLLSDLAKDAAKTKNNCTVFRESFRGTSSWAAIALKAHL